MRIDERLLAALSRDPVLPDYDANSGPESVEGAVDDLRDVFQEFDATIRGKRVLDYGCGRGRQVVRMAQLGACVFGLDSREHVLAAGRDTAHRYGVDAQFGTCATGAFDIVLSKNSMEHFGDPAGALREMAGFLAPNGRILISFSPPWYAPYGGHMQFFCRVPWAHLLFPESTVMRVRARYRSDGATCHAEVEGGLNKMSVARFERLVRASHLRVAYCRYDTVKRLPVARVPVLRELFINRISCVLARQDFLGTEA